MSQLLFSTRFFPVCLRREHPLVRQYLRRSGLRGLSYVVLGGTLGLFLAFGGLSLPMLYLLFSLTIVMQQTLATANKVQTARINRTWDLVRLTPVTQRELLLSTWAGSFWQMNQTWIMALYRMLQGLAVVGVMVYGFWFGAIPIEQWLVVLVVGTVIIAAQPFAEMYLSGMIGLLCARLIPDRASALAAAALITLLLWSLVLGSVLLTLFADMNHVGFTQVMIALALPLLLPLILGYAVQRAAELTNV